MLPPNALAPNTLIHSRYQIVRQIGQGGMGAVYEAIDTRLSSRVALKQMLVDGDQFSRAFEREAKLLANLRHPALPRVTDFFVDDVGHFLIMDFIVGDDLGKLLHQRGGPFPVGEVLRWASETLDTLEYLHGQNPPIIHRDIKPQNLKLTPHGSLSLLDFGLAKGIAILPTQMATSRSLFGYSPQYAPLEQIQGTGTDVRSDLYALGATLYHLFTGFPPANSMSRAAALINGQPSPLRPAHELNPQVPYSVGAALMRALAMRADARPASAAAMHALLRDAQQANVTPPTIAITPPPALPTIPANPRPVPAPPPIIPVSPRPASLPPQPIYQPIPASPVSQAKRPSYLKAFLLQVLFGFGLFAVDGRRRRKWIYPLVVAYAFFDVMLAVSEQQPFNGNFGAATFVIALLIYAAGFLDVLITCWLRRRKPHVV